MNKPKRTYTRRPRPEAAQAPVGLSYAAPTSGGLAPATTGSAEFGGFTAVETAPHRPEIRAAMRAEDPRAAAARRAAEIRGHIGDLDDEPDWFAIPKGYVPDGWAYQWCRDTCVGQKDESHQVELARKGWTPVPRDRHPSMMPPGSSNPVIERKGMVLYERPKEIDDEVRAADHRKATGQLRDKVRQIGVAPPDQFQRTVHNVDRSYEHIPVPKS